MVSLAQLVRASDCGSEGRGFEPHTSPQKQTPNFKMKFGVCLLYLLMFEIYSNV